jgi:hypothetical protein
LYTIEQLTLPDGFNFAEQAYDIPAVPPRIRFANTFAAALQKSSAAAVGSYGGNRPPPRIMEIKYAIRRSV